MSNAIASLSVWSPTRRNFVRKLLNAQEKKTSFNLTLDHQFDKHLTLSASYDHMNNKWSAKNGLTLDPKWGYKSIDDVNVAINFLRPANHYALNLSYENAKLYTGLLANRYTGNNRQAFTSRSFLLLDRNVNYQVTPDLNVYMLVTNLTNTAYETMFYSANGIGGSAMPSRSILFGAKYSF